MGNGYTALLRLAEGGRTPLTKYNEAIQSLQCRRSMMSIAKQKSQFWCQWSSDSWTNTPSPTTNPPLENPAATPDRNDSEGMLVDEDVEEELKGASEGPNDSEIESLIFGWNSRTDSHKVEWRYRWGSSGCYRWIRIWILRRWLRGEQRVAMELL